MEFVAVDVVGDAVVVVVVVEVVVVQSSLVSLSGSVQSVHESGVGGSSDVQATASESSIMQKANRTQPTRHVEILIITQLSLRFVRN